MTNSLLLHYSVRVSNGIEATEKIGIKFQILPSCFYGIRLSSKDERQRVRSVVLRKMEGKKILSLFEVLF